MEIKSYQGIFREFLRMCPYVKEEIVRWRKGEEYEIIVELRDGTAYRYDYVTKTFKWARSSREFTRKPRNEEEWRNFFARRLHRKMVICGYTQDDLSYETGISAGTISRYINGEAMPTAYKLIQIADVLDCSVNDLVYFD